MVCCQVRTESKNNSWRSFTCVMAMKLWHLNRWAWIMEYYGQNCQTDTLVIIIWGYWVSASAGGCPEDPEYDTMQQWDRAHCEICQGTAPDIRTVHAETMFMQLNRWCGPIRASVCVCVCVVDTRGQTSNTVSIPVLLASCSSTPVQPFTPKLTLLLLQWPDQNLGFGFITGHQVCWCQTI